MSKIAESDLKNTITRVVKEEADAVSHLTKLAEPIGEAVLKISQSDAPLIISGVGKSGHIGAKIASTFRSLGKPSIFVHAADASHGDLGLIQKDSVVVILSNSGETTELSDLLVFCEDQGNPVIAICGNSSSTLARHADIPIIYSIEREACRNGLAPTTSTTVALVIGDALAVGYSELTERTPEDFGRYHPGGNLAARLRTARSLMTSIETFPTVEHDASIDELLLTMSEGKLGFGVLMKDGQVFGVVSDGDLRRNASRLMDLSPSEIATKTPISISADMRAEDIQAFLSEKKVSQALVYDGDKFVGIVHLLALKGAG